ncbi:uncharacterized protein LOC122375121 isoform X1 [Amphibalanus amphitrite]|uniref:uncharacterized protein LOC122375121 isoform X1 n=1 Tax=Amphibalanus amphitrite TaxID=1232801 RepID=UPI001C90EE11|nr:uncharacterized protein LOC122375121 isoform X1 [Amphibalanus amphitrite]
MSRNSDGLHQIKEAIKAQNVCTTKLLVRDIGLAAEEGKKGKVCAGLLQTVAEHCSDEVGSKLVLLLVTSAGADVAGGDGEAALQSAVSRCLPHTVQALLQCGVEPPEALSEQCPLELADLVELFRPGLWTAVAEERLGDVRRLLNLWCRVDLRRNGRTLRQLALDTGNESIISLILNIEPTMKCAFLVLAGDEDGLAEHLASPAGKKVNPNFRKQSERGAPLLYFAAASGSAANCRLLVERGASVGVQMRDTEGADLPLIFALLNSSTSPEVIRCVLPPGVCEDGCDSPSGRQGRQLLQSVCYRCRNVLTHSVEADLAPEVIATLLQAAGPELVCERGTDNLCLAERLVDRPPLLTLLRATVRAWTCGGAARHHLVPLLVRGCDWLEPLLAGDGRLVDGLRSDSDKAAGDVQDGPQMAGAVQQERQTAGEEVNERLASTEEPAASMDEQERRLSSFLQERRSAQGVVDALYRCLKEDCPQEDFDRLAEQLPNEWLWHARPTGSGTPLLVLAALTSRPAAVARLSRGLSSVDLVRDGFRRTALHYACGTDCQPVRRALLRAGGSEHTLDVHGREPLDFTDVVGSERLAELLRMRRDQEYTRAEPDPWEPEHRRQLQDQRRRQRFLDPALRHAHSSHSHSGHVHLGHVHGGAAFFPTAAGSDFRWPLPPDYSRASFGTAATGGATGEPEPTRSTSCVLS